MPKKFVVRINNLQDKEPEDNYDQHMVTTIHWHRVIGFGFAILLLVALLSWLVIAMLSNSPEEISTDEAQLPAVADVFKEPESSSVVGENAPAPELPLPDQAPAEQLSGELHGTGEEIHPSTAAVASAEQFVGEEIISVVAEDIPDFVAGSDDGGSADPASASGVFADENEPQAASEPTRQPMTDSSAGPVGEASTEPGTELEGTPILTQSGATQSSATQRNENAAEVNVGNATKSDVNDPGFASEADKLPVVEGLSERRVAEILDKYGLRSSGSRENVVIHSQGIRRAQLTSRVERKQPLDRLGSVIYMTNDQLLRVFLFTEMSGLAGRTLYHRWYLDEEQMAEVTINVRNDDVSASSSKFIDKFMLGNWTVRVEDDLGNLLVTAEFAVRAG